MYVVKRSGKTEPVLFDKITHRLTKLCYNLDKSFVDPLIVTKKVIQGVFTGVTTSELDELAAETAASLMTHHPDYGILAARIAVSNLHKNTKKSFIDTMTDLYTFVDTKTNKPAPLISTPVYTFMKTHQDELQSAIQHERDNSYDFFGFKTLERSYLLRINDKVAERPQHMLMRVACGIHCGEVKAALETYHYLSLRYFTHASPTLFNAGTPNAQMSSCFLLTMQEDSLEGIYNTLKQTAIISRSAGGIGLAVHNIRATNSYIRGTNGKSNGLVPMLRVFNNTARYVDQGGGKRKGAFAVYLEPWHADVKGWLDLCKNQGSEELRARDLKLGLWIPDLFMKRVEKNETWTLFCPNEAPGLHLVWGEEFEKLYHSYEAKKLGRASISARELFAQIVETQQETGTPYVLFKDTINRKNNQSNLGTIKGSNLCTEIVQYFDANEIAVCNLASVALPAFVNVSTQTFDFQQLFKIIKIMTRNLNKIIDVNYYPLPETERSNLRHRPIGLGVQGLADTFIKLRMPFESPQAEKLNKQIFETIYFAALTASNELAKENGRTYESYPGSPISQGQLQFDLWNVTPSFDLWNWNDLRQEIKTHGVYNSLLVAPMPTASTSQILGWNEAFEPYTSNLYVRRVLSGEFICVNRHLLMDLVERKLWTEDVKNQLIKYNGSVQNIPEIPHDLKELYKTVWEISQKQIVNMAADRGAFIDQSQSLNIHMHPANNAKVSSLHFYAWKKGLKTGMYYLRTQPAQDAIKFTLDTKHATKFNSDNHSGNSINVNRNTTTTPNKTPTPSANNSSEISTNTNNSSNGSNDFSCLPTEPPQSNAAALSSSKPVKPLSTEISDILNVWEIQKTNILDADGAEMDGCINCSG